MTEVVLVSRFRAASGGQTLVLFGGFPCSKIISIQSEGGAILNASSAICKLSFQRTPLENPAYNGYDPCTSSKNHCRKQSYHP
jgi:hypothetical protein